MRRKLFLWSVLLIAGFLAGFILQYSRVQRLQRELSVSTKQLESCHSGEQLAQLRDTATMMYLEATQKNHGRAGEYSKECFDQAQRIASSTEDPALRNVLLDVPGTRDQITADLAKGDAAAVSATVVPSAEASAPGARMAGRSQFRTTRMCTIEQI